MKEEVTKNVQSMTVKSEFEDKTTRENNVYDKILKIQTNSELFIEKIHFIWTNN